MKWTVRLVTVCALAALILGDNLPSRAAATGGSPVRLIVKARPELALELERALPAATLRLEPTAPASPRVSAFLSRHGIRQMRPLYPALVEEKKRSGRSSHEIAAGLRQTFAKRAARQPGAFAPPDVSRTYVVEVAAASAAQRDERLAAFRRDTLVEHAEVDGLVSVNLVPNDPYFFTSGSWGQAYDDLYGLKKIDSANAWDVAGGD